MNQHNYPDNSNKCELCNLVLYKSVELQLIDNYVQEQEYFQFLFQNNVYRYMSLHQVLHSLVLLLLRHYPMSDQVQQFLFAQQILFHNMNIVNPQSNRSEYKLLKQPEVLLYYDLLLLFLQFLLQNSVYRYMSLHLLPGMSVEL